MHRSKEFQKVKYSESLASIFGASFIAFALGIWFSEIFSGFVGLILVIGLLLHSWGMYMTYQRNT